MTEFGDNGYAKASTNRIVQAAGIGKGMLFYYFGSKLELYNALIDRSCLMLRESLGKILGPFGQWDILEAIQRATRVKMEMYLKEPALFDFLTRLYLHPDEASMTDETKRRFSEILVLREQVMETLFAKADLSRLRPDIPAQRLVRYLSWAMEGYTQETTATIRQSAKRLSDMDFDPYWAEFDTYIEDLKTMFYKEER